jgi:hypothetical protein
MPCVRPLTVIVACFESLQTFASTFGVRERTERVAVPGVVGRIAMRWMHRLIRISITVFAILNYAEDSYYECTNCIEASGAVMTQPANRATGSVSLPSMICTFLLLLYLTVHLFS